MNDANSTNRIGSSEAPVISVIIPVYNNTEQELARCLNSIAAQGYDYTEIVIVDDGCNDEVRNALQLFADNDSRIKLVRQDNSGVSAARNRGIKEAQGDYITFLDADDELDAGFFAEGIPMVQKEKLDLLIGGARKVRPGSSEDNKTPMQSEAENEQLNVYGTEERSEVRRTVFQINYGEVDISKGPWCRILKREIASQVPFYEDIHIAEDVVWNAELINRCNRIGVARRPWYRYCLNENSATHKYNPTIIDESCRMLDRFRAQMDMGDDSDFMSYCSAVSNSLYHIYEQLLTREEWNASKSEKKAVIRRLYKEEPWSPLGSKRSLRLSSGKRKIKAWLYRHSLLFNALKHMGREWS